MKENKLLLDAFFALLRAGLWGVTPNPALFVDMGRKEWGALLQMAQKQAVLGLVYAGISRLPKEQMPESQLLLRLYGLVEQIRKQSTHIDAVTEEICGWLEAEGLEPMVLKGRSVGSFYADPDIRQSGDIDLFFHRDYDKVVDIVQRRGIRVELDANHDKFWYQGILIELHSQPFRPLYPILDLDLLPVWQETALGRYRVLNLKANALLLLLHPSKHFMNEGVGLRQVCDWAVFLKKYEDAPELLEVFAEMKKQGAMRFVTELTSLAILELGLELNHPEIWLSSSKEKLHRRMLQLVLVRGNFAKESKKKRRKQIWNYFFSLGKYFWQVYPYWPAYFWKKVPQRVFKRFNFIIQGKVSATK